jgi:hypothetical protein
MGHTSTNKKGFTHSSYICGNKYRTRTCCAKNGSAAELESFVVAQLKDYLNNSDYEELAQTIADKVNAASVDLSREKKEVAEITTKIANGVKAMMNFSEGFAFPELEEEISALRIRKSELEDIIARNSVNTKKLDAKRLVEFFRLSAASMEENPREVVRQHITKIYAHADGSFTVNVGVHFAYCGGNRGNISQDVTRTQNTLKRRNSLEVPILGTLKMRPFFMEFSSVSHRINRLAC